MDFPKTFADKKGREWTVHIGLAANARLRAAGIPLEEFVPMPSAKMAKQAPDLSELTDLLHGSFNGIRAVQAILMPELVAQKISDEDFLDSIDDEKITAKIGQALYQAILDFFQKSPLRRSLVKQAWKQGQGLMAAAARELDRTMARIDQDQATTELDKRMATAADEFLKTTGLPIKPDPGNNFAGNTPE